MRREGYEVVSDWGEITILLLLDLLREIAFFAERRG